jgi:hypothetical protein
MQRRESCPLALTPLVTVFRRAVRRDQGQRWFAGGAVVSQSSQSTARPGSELRLARAPRTPDAIEPLRAEHRSDKGAQLRFGQLAGDTAESIPQLRHGGLARGECGGGLRVEHTCTPGRHAACRVVDGMPSNRGNAPNRFGAPIVLLPSGAT